MPLPEIVEQVGGWISSLDWSFILTFILIAYAVNQQKIKSSLFAKTGIKIKTRYRTLLIGVVYGTVLFFLRGYSIEKIECLFQSLVFAFTFHKLIADRVIAFLERAFTGGNRPPGNPPASNLLTYA